MVYDFIKTNLWFPFLITLFVIEFFLMIIIMPFHSPDEQHHVIRAYLLKERVLILGTQGNGSGGMVDKGLIKYIISWTRYIDDDKIDISKKELINIEKIRWEGTKEFVAVPGTAFYFPIIYAPQAIGLAIGEIFKLSVDSSYKLAKVMVLLFINLILFFSFYLFKPPLLILILLLFPMNLFQNASLVIDGNCTALIILVISIYLKIITENNGNIFYVLLLALSIFILITCRLNLFPLIFLFFYLYYKKRNRVTLISIMAILLLTFIWILVVLKTIDFRSDLGNSASEIAFYYFKDPFSFFKLIYKTLSSDGVMQFYINSFIGALGKLNIYFDKLFYIFTYLFVISFVIISTKLTNLLLFWKERILLFFIFLFSFLMIFFLLTYAWNKHPAVFIDGIQGRYFIHPIIILIYSLFFSLNQNYLNSFFPLFNPLTILLFSLLSLYNTTNILLSRYFTPIDYQKIDLNRIISINGDRTFGPLTNKRVFMQRFKATGSFIYEIKLLLATFSRNNSGTINLSVLNEEGKVLFFKSLDINKLYDNSWVTISAGFIPVTNGKFYTMKLISNNATEENSITWWASSKSSYSEGEAIVDSIPQDSDFAFEILFIGE